MPDVWETISRLDAANDYIGINDFIVREARDPNELAVVVHKLLTGGRHKGAYLVAKMLAGAGVAHPHAAYVQALGGLLFSDQGDEAEGARILSVLVGMLRPEQYAVVSQTITNTLPPLIHAAYLAKDHRMVMRMLEIMKAGIPALRPIFDMRAAAKPFDAAEQARLGRAKAKLIALPVPPPGAPRRQRQAVVTVRERWDANNPSSRLYDVGPRVAAALNAYGWRATFQPMYRHELKHVESEYREIAALCLQIGAEVLVIDDDTLFKGEKIRVWRNALFAELRQKLPGIKIVSIYFDPWAALAEELRLDIAGSDLAWAPFPSLPIWSEPAFARKFLPMTFPHGGVYGPPPARLPPNLAFLGGVNADSWHRYFWLSGAATMNLPVAPKLSSHMPDGMGALDSYRAYMKSIGDAGTCLNLSMRRDLSRVLTGRTFEAILAGALLVQETSPDLDYFFIAGEHYLEFSTLAELRSVAEFVVAHPDQAEAIRRRGYAFAAGRYSDDKIVSYLDAALYPAR